jgi:hypothetical protein
MNQEMIDALIKIARGEAWCDDEDFNPYDYCGGNYDDAYYGGCSDGEILLARQVLTSMKIEW